MHNLLQNRTLLNDDEKLRVRRIGDPRIQRGIAGSVVRHSDQIQPSASPPDYSALGFKDDHSYQPSSEGDDSFKPSPHGGYSYYPSSKEDEQPRRRPPFMRSTGIPAPLASVEGSRLSAASEGFDIGPSSVYLDDRKPDQKDQETKV